MSAKKKELFLFLETQRQKMMMVKKKV